MVNEKKCSLWVFLYRISVRGINNLLEINISDFIAKYLLSKPLYNELEKLPTNRKSL